jgi:hypothetical protein
VPKRGRYITDSRNSANGKTREMTWEEYGERVANERQRVMEAEEKVDNRQ